MKRFNDWLALMTTNGVGTMWTAYLFFLWALLPLVMPQAQNIVQYVSQSVIQLVLLPVIIVGQNVAAAIAERRDIETHDAVMGELSEIKQMHTVQRESYAQRDAKLDAILAQKEESDAERDAKLNRILELLEDRKHRR